MKRKLLVFITVLAMVMSLVPMSVQAAGTGDGTSIENAFVVDDYTTYQTAIADPALSFIETSGYVDYLSSASIPNGKTVIVQPVPDMEYAAAIGWSFGSSVIVEEGGTLINNGGITYTDNNALLVRGSLINNAAISGVYICLEGSGVLANEASALIDERSAILIYSGSLVNAGTISCLVNQIGTDAECLFSGIDPAIIRHTDAPVNYSEMTFTPLTLPENETTTVGMTGDNSTLIYDPDGYLVFAMGYKVDLQAGQTIVVQQSSDFRPYLYLLQDEGYYVDASSMGGLRYTAVDTETIRIVTGGYDTIDFGSLTVTVYDPDANTNGGLDFTDPAAPVTGDGWAWDSAAQTLTLSGLMLSAANTNGITLPGGSTIVLEAGSENFIQSDYEYLNFTALAVSPDESMAGIYCSGSLTIAGSGSLTVNAVRSGLTCDGTLTINEQGTLYFGGNEGSGIFAAEGIVMEDCYDLSAFGNNAGIASGGAIHINNSSIVAYGWQFGILTGSSYGSERKISYDYAGGNIEITDSQIDASSSLEPHSGAAIYAGDNNFDANTGVHSKIIINNGGILLPGSGSICNVAIIDNPRCQTISSIEGLSEITSWAQASKSVLFMPAVELTYNSNGGSGTMEDAASPYLKSETAAVLVNQFARDGYTFTGWNTEADGSGTSYEPAATSTINNDITLFAIWQIQTFTVTFTDWNGTVLSEQTVDYGAPAVAPAMPSRSGYQFSTWDSKFSVISSDRTITALYTLIPTTTPTAAPTTTPASTPTPTVTATPTPAPVVLAAAKTGETGYQETAAAIFTISAMGLFAVQFILRKKTQE